LRGVVVGGLEKGVGDNWGGEEGNKMGRRQGKDEGGKKGIEGLTREGRDGRGRG